MGQSTTKHLKADHEGIERALAAFEKYLARTEEDYEREGPSAVAPQELWGLLDYLMENFFIRHEEKEEVVLLPELVRHGLSWTDGPLALVRQQHRHGRYLMRCVRQAAHLGREWGQEDCRHFISTGREWISFMRHHMQAEEKQMFPFLERGLSTDQDANLTEQFDRIDEDFAAMRDADQLREGGEAFIAKYTS